MTSLHQPEDQRDGGLHLATRADGLSLDVHPCGGAVPH